MTTRKPFGRERPFGSIGVDVDLAMAIGEDPRPFLTDEQIAEQLRISGKTRDEWDAAWEEKLKPPF